MSNPILTAALFDSLKTGTVVSVTWHSCMSSRTKPLLLRVGRRSWSKKYQTATLALDNMDGTKGREMNRVRLYKRGDGQVYEALGDMAITFTSFKIVPEPASAAETEQVPVGVVGWVHCGDMDRILHELVGDA